MPYNFAAESFAQKTFVPDFVREMQFYSQNGHFVFLRLPSGALGTTYAVHLIGLLESL